MAYSSSKPLPGIPDVTHVYGLCVESNILLNTLLHQAIVEQGLENYWSESIRGALCDLGRYIESKDIIVGICSLRKLGNQFNRSFAGFDSNWFHQAQQDRTKSKVKTGTDRLKVIELDATESHVPSISTESKLKAIRQRISSQPPLLPLAPMHLLIAVSSLTTTIKEDFDTTSVGIDSKPSEILFQKDVFHLSSQGHNDSDGGSVIHGLDNWQSDLHSTYIVGGTFTFKNISSERLFESLLSILRVSLYVYLSLLLEQKVLHTFHVPLQHPPLVPPPSRSHPKPPTLPISIPDEFPSTVENRKTTASKSGSGIWSFISRKTENIFHRVSGSAFLNTEDEDAALSPITPGETGPYSRDPISECRQDNKVGSSRVSNTVEGFEREQSGPFTASVQGLLDSTCILSTSLRVRFPPPPLLLQLAAREEEQGSFNITLNSNSSISSSNTSAATNHHIRITGIEKTGLSSIIGWENRESRGKGMRGIKGFIRQQGITVLYRKYARVGSLKRLCGKPFCMTYRYYLRNGDDHTTPDPCIGEVIETLCHNELSGEQCPIENCKELLCNHVHSWTCDNVTIEAYLDKNVEHHYDRKDGDIAIWQSCSICKEETPRTKIDAGTYLFSFSKFLEILVWSPIMHSLPLCSHGTRGATFQHSNHNVPRNAPYNLICHFLHNDHTLSLFIKPTSHSVFEIQFPRLQIVSANSPGGDRSSKVKYDQEKQVLEAEIEDWWRAINKHVDKLDGFLKSLTETNKDLPPLPDSDDEDEEEEVSKGVSLLSPVSSHPTPPIAQVSSNAFRSFSPGYTIWSNIKNVGRTVPYPPSVPCRAVESRVLLAQLSLSFKESKEGLRNQVIDTPVSSLNDARQRFRSSAQGALKRLSAWQKKHAPGAPEYLEIKNPEWWNNCHAVPGGRVLVREDESGSIIAFTLSSLVYQRELAHLSSPSSRHTQSKQANPSVFQGQDSIPPPPSVETSKSSIISPDPDLDGRLWSQQDTFVVTITRCEHPREESILGLRDVFRAVNASDPSTLNSRFTQESASKGTSALFPLSVWAQPQVQVSLNAADGELMQPLDVKSAEILSDSRLSHGHISTSASSPQDHDRAPIPLLSQEHDNLNRSTQKSSSDMNFQGMKHEVFLAAPQPVSVSSSLQIARASTPTQSSSLTETLTNAMRYLLTSGTRPPSPAPSPAPSSTLHSLLAYDTLFSIDEQPHIRYDCTIGQRLKFSCTVYYAKQFDSIRKRCGVDTDIITSLQQSENWLMDGGKSKSNFWRSSDKRFIIKTLVNAWTVSDLQVLIELAPSYFRYIGSTATKASALAKLMGFYTVEVKNLETGVIQMKHDVLVMENLFYEHTISRIYDLKGISSRKVKIKAEQSRDKTLYDVEWNEAQEHDPILLRSCSAYILQEALRADTEFLARSNIMDYSLLLGVDEEKSCISCGIVDTIGSYTFTKTLEYKAKHNLIANRGREVTVIPPTEYQHRFVTALEAYFLACPDKWTKPRRYVDRTKPHELPDVF